MKNKIIRLSALGALTALACAGCASGNQAAPAGGGATVAPENIKTSPTDTAVSCVPSSSALDAIKVSGEHNGTVKLESGTPITVDKQQARVLDAGKGKPVKSGQTVKANLSLFNGKDGKLLASQAGEIEVDEKTTPAWLGQALGCANVDGRVVSAIKISQGFGSAPDLPGGLTGEDTAILVIDLNGISKPPAIDPEKLLKKAEGEAKPAPAGFPTVKLNEDGSPEITMPEGVKAPDKLSIATLIEGKGDTVKPGDRVYVNYRGVIWRDGKEFDSSWKRGKPVDFTTDGVIKGFKDALEGHTVGSQVIAVVPANDGGYGADALKQQGHQPDDVMVFVLDILGTSHAE